ncbi:hypothetical protein [Anditalea andensis]|uniref:Outer membrane protein beta-barrel domain-containing protein n=1 Tax=Anditalea andensis TaxID=1048983 RepID=A0A074L3M8_9BACT|nr:hypothetical protein [Anditalea andensis]KEO74458.1 hypothetical protein EL17_06895 [Anditalea andensis]
MNNKFIILLPIFLISLSCLGQHAYFQVGGGYTFPTSAGQGGEIVTLGPNGNLLNIKNTRSELGAGVPLTVRAGYMINNFVGADLGFNYLIGEQRVVSQILANSEMANVSGQTRQARLNPAIVFSTNRDLDLSAYSRVGLVLPLGGVTTVKYDIPGTFTTNERKHCRPKR